MADDSAATTDGPEAEPSSPERSSIQRQAPALLALGAIAVLLIGIVVGVLLRLGFENDDPKTDKPGIDSAAVGFALDMETHHKQGIEMATIVLGSADLQVRSTAYDILTAQTNQVGQMQSWLTRWGYPLDRNQGTVMDWMKSTDGGHGGMHMGGSTSAAPTSTGAAEKPLMPGMATRSEMAKLYALKGKEQDVYFLQLMTRHHEGGTPMMEYAANKANVSQDYVRQLAQNMINVQTTEVTTMTAMLKERGSQPLPMN